MSDDAVIIPFPVRDVGTDDLVDLDGLRDHDEAEELDDALALEGFVMHAVEPCVGCGSTEQDEHLDGCTAVPEEDPDEIIEAGGRWVWQPLGSPPEKQVPVGMVSYRIETMCRWTHRHLMDGVSIPQECCYSVLHTLARLPGEVQTERNWLAMQEEDPPS